MIWNEPADTQSTNAELEARLWDSANNLWANAALKPSEYSPVVLGLIFLRFADVRFAEVEAKLKPKPGSRRKIGPADYHAEGVLFLPESARFETLINLPEGAEIGEAINAAMRAIEKENTDLADVLPKTYHILENTTLTQLLKDMKSIPMDRGGDTFGLIYEYFLGKFAMSEGQKGGEFYTPTSLVRLIVEILEPYHGRILDPACGSGGMFVQSARFVEEHHKNPTAEISVYGQERVTETSRLARLNLAVHGLTGEIKQGNTFYEDLHNCVVQVPIEPSPQSSPKGRGSQTYAGESLISSRGGLFFSGLKERARELRQAQTEAEAFFWELVRGRKFEGLKFRRQHQIGDYIVDFYCHEKRLVIELDGEVHEGAKQKKHDAQRDKYLTSLGNQVLRFKNKALLETPEKVFQEILSKLPQEKLPSPRGRGAGGEGDKVERQGRFDFVLANPPFNVSKVDKERLVDDPRYPFGLPKTDNANYLWIQQFYSSLNAKGRAGFVMANSASDARSSEQAIRQQLIESGAVDVMVAIGPNFFYTVTLPCALWFFDKSKLGTEREDTVLFIDARHIFRQVDRAHRDFTPAQMEFIANIVRLYRGQQPEFVHGSEAKLLEVFGGTTSASSATPEAELKVAEDPISYNASSSSSSGKGAGKSASSIAYRDVLGLCKSSSRAAIEAQGWSLNPGRYVGVVKGEELSDEDFKGQFEALNEELVVLNTEARELEERIAKNAEEVLEIS
jgi:type I restriction-modification system DNA methylase subunit/very-short-patch-repair endonuclease